MTVDRVAEQPQRWRPQSDEQRPALGVSALVLIDGLCSLPQRDAQGDRPE